MVCYKEKNKKEMISYLSGKEVQAKVFFLLKMEEFSSMFVFWWKNFSNKPKHLMALL